MIDYRLNAMLDVDAVIELFIGSTLARQRAVDDRERMRTMLACSNLTIAAFDGEQLIGLARSVSDYAYVTYLSDLAVDAVYQRRGIGRTLVECTRGVAPMATLVLLAGPDAGAFYQRIGLTRNAEAWILMPGARLR